MILQGIDLEFAPGAVNVILGPNGAGKSTLLRLLGLLDKPGRGEIYYDGLKLSGMTRSACTRLRRRSGFVFQSPLLLAGTVAANLRFGPRLRHLSVSEREISRVLEKTGLSGRLEQDAQLLSGGEKQRLQLARVMLLDPDLYLLDEPTANLDPLSVKNIEAVDRPAGARGQDRHPGHPQSHPGPLAGREDLFFESRGAGAGRGGGRSA